MDIEDEEDYNKRFKIKKENIQKRLNNLISLSEKEKEGLSIVAVAANPFGWGLEYWLEHKEEFQKLSRIKTLQDATQKKIKENGGKLTIIEEAKKSVIQDVVYRQMPLAKKTQQNLKRELEYLDKAIKKRQGDLDNLSKDISNAQKNLHDFITNYFDYLIRQVAGVSMATFNSFFEREIGEEGKILDEKIKKEFERQTQGILNEIAKIETSFNADMSLFEKHAGTFGKIGSEFLTKSGFINANTIKIVRDGIVNAAKFVGIDLAFKFKPWGAVKLAGNLNKALPFIGIAFETWDSYNKYQKEQALEEAKKGMVSYFGNQKKEILDLINDETRFKQTCFLSALELEKSLQEIKEAIEKTQACDQEFEKWIKAGEDLIKGEDFIEVEPEEE